MAKATHDKENKTIVFEHGRQLITKLKYYVNEVGMNVFQICDESLNDLIDSFNKDRLAEPTKEEPKQILVWRKDLRNTKGEKVRTGKCAAQLAHASLGAILNYVTFNNIVGIMTLSYAPLREWILGRFTKVAVYVNSEQELLDIQQKCIDNNINVKLITDAGLTEFGNVPTHTCLAIGPDYPSKLDPLFRHLPLL